MNSLPKLRPFAPHSVDTAGVLSWVHIGDVHMREAGQQNDLDLRAIVEEINHVFTRSISFVFLPGDNADHGDVESYTVVRHAIDALQVPWCAIVGDHDVEGKSLTNFRTFMSAQTHYAFTAGNVRFLALNAFDVPEPPSFAVLHEQLLWLEDQLRDANDSGRVIVLLLHCYPSDLKQGGEELMRLIATYGVRLVDMGHTHYNEISHDAKTLYTATRSTGQIEEGPVGFSVTNIDDNCFSWKFFEVGELPAVMITSPSDERFLADGAELGDSAVSLRVRAKVWAEDELQSVKVSLGEAEAPMRRVPGSNVWEVTVPCEHLSGVHALRVVARDARGGISVDEVQALLGSDRQTRTRAQRDQDNALDAWPEHGLLGTQLGPNKHGRKW